MRDKALITLLLAASAAFATCKCPFGFGNDLRSLDLARPRTRALLQYDRAAAAKLDLAAVRADLTALMTDSQAWHCAGSYRSSDGRGGCDGGRQRFDPERSWDDNTNLDKAKALLWPIKQKYGAALSWGDLIILAGDVAISSMGGPVLGFCGGRIDDLDGSESVPLGPSPEQEALMPCPVQGDCQSPLGQNTLGLIYVNPEGPMGQPLPERSAAQIREVFGRMGMDDAETVALIGGGHAFGKAHGACPTGPGPSPREAPDAPWPGTCGDGRGNRTFTSGFEGPWTTTPTAWDNQYKLVTRDMGPVTRCLGPDCASTFRETDYSGGCNGARIRFAPQKDWPQNAYMDSVLAVLEPLKAAYPPTLSSADLIVLAGTVALQEALAEAEAEAAAGCQQGTGPCTAAPGSGSGGVRLRFCGGRVDAVEGGQAGHAQPPRVLADKILQVRDNAHVMGLSLREAVALAARPRSPSQQRRLGYSGAWTPAPSRLSNQYFKVLLGEAWQRGYSSEGLEEFSAAGGGKGLFMTPSDLAIKWDAEMLAIAQEFASDNTAFLQTFAAAWTRLMNADRFDGPDGNLCNDDEGGELAGALLGAAAVAAEEGARAASEKAAAVVQLVLEASYGAAARVEEEFVELPGAAPHPHGAATIGTAFTQCVGDQLGGGAHPRN
eukprot:XP_001689728.1 catalase/peroxidase [Chlamydomonas reinhardtii]